MSSTPTVDTLLHQASHLSTDEQLLLLERLASMLRTHTTQSPIQKERRLGMYV